MDNFLESYLVKLGFSVDEPSATKFRDTMSMAESQVTAHTSGMAKRVLEAQGAIVGAFVSISSAIIGTVDKAAMADQGYRLLGLRMMMTTESARKMDIITKALGASMGEIIWDPELHQRAQELFGDMDNMTKSLGLGFESGMRGVRDLRFEFTAMVILDPALPGCPVHQIKVADEFKGILDPQRPITEETGRRMAAWARGAGETRQEKMAMDVARDVARKGTKEFTAWWQSPAGRSLRGAIRPIVGELRDLAQRADEGSSVNDDMPFGSPPSPLAAEPTPLAQAAE